MAQVSGDPTMGFDFLVNVAPASAGLQSFDLYANKVSGGELSYEKAERYCGSRTFKYMAKGRKSVGEVTVEQGLFPLTVANESEGSGVQRNIALFLGLDSSDADRCTITVTQLQADGTPDQKVVYRDCQITGVNTGDYDAQTENVAIYTLTFQPIAKEHSAV